MKKVMRYFKLVTFSVLLVMSITFCQPLSTLHTFEQFVFGILGLGAEFQEDHEREVLVLFIFQTYI